MAGLTPSQREVGWNVRILLHKGIASCLAGFYQQDDFLTLADVRRELDLCFQLDDRDAARPALLPARESGAIMLLERSNTAPFPTPPPDQQADYYYISHTPDCQTPAKEHTVSSPCVQQTARPPRRFDARYLPIGKASDAAVVKTVPVRGKKRPRTSSSSPSQSRSPSKGGDGDGLGEDDEFPETIIPRDEAAAIMKEFRQNVIGRSNSRCTITGKGGAWWVGTGIGPAVEAAHIVPQIHWNVYPDAAQGVAPLDNISALRDAWTQTWDTSNGLLLSATIHQCFDARILSIEPDTGRIRAFMPYDLITDYHGKQANLPRGLDRQALRCHYDMCCVENMAAKRLPGLGLSTVVRNKATTMSPATPTLPDTPGDPAKKEQTRGDPRNQDATSGASNDEVGGKAEERPVEAPLSPPSSDWGQKTIWRYGGMRLTDPRQVQQLREKGWLVYEEHKDASDQSSEEERGRPRKRKCTGSYGRR